MSARQEREAIQRLKDAIEFAETYYPLPRCTHGNALQDHAGDLLVSACSICKTLHPEERPASTARTDGWVSVEERLPEDSEIVLLFHRDGIVSVTTFGVRDKGKWLDYNNTTDDYPNEIRKITHWQPLPAAPGSVPQAPDQSAALRTALEALAQDYKEEVRNAEASFAYMNAMEVLGVPQAEPPKEEKP